MQRFAMWLLKKARMDFAIEEGSKVHAPTVVIKKCFDGSVEFHLSELITTYDVLTFGGPNHQVEKQPKIVQELFRIKGIVSITLRSYLVDIRYSLAFNGDDISEKVRNCILKHIV